MAGGHGVGGRRVKPSPCEGAGRGWQGPLVTSRLTDSPANFGWGGALLGRRPARPFPLCPRYSYVPGTLPGANIRLSFPHAGPEISCEGGGYERRNGQRATGCDRNSRGRSAEARPELPNFSEGENGRAERPELRAPRPPARGRRIPAPFCRGGFGFGVRPPPRYYLR